MPIFHRTPREYRIISCLVLFTVFDPPPHTTHRAFRHRIQLRVPSDGATGIRIDGKVVHIRPAGKVPAERQSVKPRKNGGFCRTPGDGTTFSGPGASFDLSAVFLLWLVQVVDCFIADAVIA